MRTRGSRRPGSAGRPGIASARWASDGVAQLLAELAPLEDRRARYVCVIVAIGPAGEEVVAEGTLAGTIALERRGAEGFGYDPIFVPDGRDEHRRRARRRLEDGQFAPGARCGRAGGSPGKPAGEADVPSGLRGNW